MVTNVVPTPSGTCRHLQCILFRHIPGTPGTTRTHGDIFGCLCGTQTSLAFWRYIVLSNRSVKARPSQFVNNTIRKAMSRSCLISLQLYSIGPLLNNVKLTFAGVIRKFELRNRAQRRSIHKILPRIGVWTKIACGQQLPKVRVTRRF